MRFSVFGSCFRLLAVIFVSDFSFLKRICYREGFMSVSLLLERSMYLVLIYSRAR